MIIFSDNNLFILCAFLYCCSRSGDVVVTSSTPVVAYAALQAMLATMQQFVDRTTDGKQINYNNLQYVILTIVGDWVNKCALLSRTDCFWFFVWTTTPRR